MGILWHKRLSPSVKVHRSRSKRAFAIILTLQNSSTLGLINVYLPCDNYKPVVADPEYAEALTDLEVCLTELNADSVIIGGDMNTDFSRKPAHSGLLSKLCERHNLRIGWNSRKAHPVHTYVSSDLRSRSCIDHFMVSTQLFSEIEDYV